MTGLTVNGTLSATTANLGTINVNNLTIIEDDAKFLNSFSSIKNIPDDWDMIYYGGTVHRIIDKKYQLYPSLLNLCHLNVNIFHNLLIYNKNSYILLEIHYLNYKIHNPLYIYIELI
jgi:hypothetical protein